MVNLDTVRGVVARIIASFDGNYTPCPLTISPGFFRHSYRLRYNTGRREVNTMTHTSVSWLSAIKGKRHPTAPSHVKSQSPQFVVLAFSARFSGQKYLRHILIFVKIIIYL